MTYATHWQFLKTYKGHFVSAGINIFDIWKAVEKNNCHIGKITLKASN